MRSFGLRLVRMTSSHAPTSTAGVVEIIKPGPAVRTNARIVIAWVATAQLVLLAAALAYIWARVFYLHDLGVVGALSYQGDERPPVPLVPWQLGVHTFGDFLLPFEQASVPNPWVDYTMWPNPYPAGLVTLFKLFTILPYKAAFVLFVLLSTLSMVLPVIHGARRLSPPVIIIAVCLFVFLSFPFAMVIDRGNAQGLTVLPIYVFAVGWREGRWRPAIFGIAIAAALKVYPALLVIALLAERRIKDALIALGACGALTVFLFALYPGGIIATLHGFLNGVARFSAPTLGGFTADNYSALGLVANGTLSLVGAASPLLTWLVANPWSVGSVYFIAVLAVVFARRLPFVIRLACAMSVLTLAIPLSYGYSLVSVMVVTAELLRQASLEGPEAELPVPLAVSLAIALTATLAEWPYLIPNDGNSFGTIIVPASWITLTATALIYRYFSALRPARRRTA